MVFCFRSAELWSSPTSPLVCLRRAVASPSKSPLPTSHLRRPTRAVKQKEPMAKTKKSMAKTKKSMAKTKKQSLGPRNFGPPFFAMLRTKREGPKFSKTLGPQKVTGRNEKKLWAPNSGRVQKSLGPPLLVGISSAATSGGAHATWPAGVPTGANNTPLARQARAPAPAVGGGRKSLKKNRNMGMGMPPFP